MVTNNCALKSGVVMHWLNYLNTSITKKNVTKHQLALMVDISQDEIRSILRGDSAPSSVQLLAITEFLVALRSFRTEDHLSTFLLTGVLYRYSFIDPKRYEENKKNVKRLFLAIL